MKRLGLVVSVAVLAAGLTLPFATTSASHREVVDGNDARGPLDMRRIVVGDVQPPRWTIYTWGSWTPAKVWDRSYLTIKFDTFGDAHFDYYALMRSDGRRLLGTLHRDYARKPDSEIARLKVTRPNKASARMRIRFGEMRFAQPGSYRWNVTTSWVSERCPKVCFDKAPNKGAIVEPAPGPIPTWPPTLTPTSSPSRSQSPSPSPSPSSSSSSQ